MQGIITVVKSVDWIKSEYEGCDTQEKIKNFITDAYEFWGTGVVLLGGDHELVPSRICCDNATGSYSSYPSDGYYSDADPDAGKSWVNSQGYWEQPDLDLKMDVCIGRVPVRTESEVSDFINKLEVYENPSSLPASFARSALFIGDSDNGSAQDGKGAYRLEQINQSLISAGVSSETGSSGQYLEPITELYWPASGTSGSYTWSGSELTRASALSNLEDGHNLIFHSAHSNTHLLGAQSAAGLANRQYITEGDIQELDNANTPGILFTTGCWPGHFQTAECIVERGLLSSDDSGLIAGIASSVKSQWNDPELYMTHFANALYEYTSYSSENSTVRIGPYRYLGESYMHMINNAESPGFSERFINLFGDPSMFIWRGNPIRPTVIASSSTVTAGTFTTTIQVSELGTDLRGAKVCLFKEDELFAIETTDLNGDAVFSNIQVASAGTITATVTKRKTGTSIVHFLPATTSITVNQNTSALLCLDELTVDDDDLSGSSGNDDGAINPGETIKFDLVVNNEGQSSATNASATLSIVSGSDQVASQTDMTETLGTVTAGPTTYAGAFELQIDDEVTAGSDPVILQVAFSYDQGSRNDPADFRVMVGELELPIRTMTITQGDPFVINIDDMFITNAGLGNLEDVQVEFTNATGGAVFTGDLTENFGDLSTGSGEGVEDGITATLRNPSSPWRPLTSSAYFDLEVSHRWGTEVITIQAEDIVGLGAVQPPSSSSLAILGADHESIDFEWDYTASGTEAGWYLWSKADGANSWTRSTTFALDPALRHGTVEDLSSGTEYDVGVSLLGQYGQESSVVSISSSTACDELEYWPVYLDGSTATGPAITDIDGDGSNEVIAATTAGSVYIIELDGSKTRIYDSSYLFSGVAIGDAISGGRDEIVVSGWDYDSGASGKKCVVVVLSWAEYVGWSGTEIDADEDSDQRIHENLTVPVIFDADGSGNLEIALRTFNGSYSGEGSSWLYVWEYSNNQWNNINSNFPYELEDGEYEYAPPVLIGDTDSDGNAELVISNGEESLLWIEPETAQNSTWSVGSVFPANYDWNLGQSFMVVVQEGSTTKLITVGRDEYNSTNGYYATVCLNAGNNGSLLWATGVNQSQDSYGNFGGPAIGDVDGDSDLDVVNQWIVSGSYHEGIIEYLTLSNGTRTTLTDVPHNEHCEDYAMSPMIIAGEDGSGLAVFGSTSTVTHGSRYHSGSPEFIPGSSYWSEDRCPSTPVVGNLDGDSDLEVIFADDSGVLYALDMNLDASSNDWPTLQHDIQRTGYFNFSGKGTVDTDCDVALISVDGACAASLANERNLFDVTISVTGTSSTDAEELDAAQVPESDGRSAAITDGAMRTSDLIGEAHESSALLPVQESVAIAVFSGRDLVDVSRIELREGVSELRLSVPCECTEEDLTFVADPFGEYLECDESNNTLCLTGVQTVPLEPVEVLASGTGITVNVPGSLSTGSVVNARLYSIDGRCVCAETIETSFGDGFSLSLSANDGSLPFGCYVIHMDNGSVTILNRKVLVIE